MPRLLLLLPLALLLAGCTPTEKVTAARFTTMLRPEAVTPIYWYRFEGSDGSRVCLVRTQLMPLGQQEKRFWTPLADFPQWVQEELRKDPKAWPIVYPATRPATSPAFDLKL